MELRISPDRRGRRKFRGLLYKYQSDPAVIASSNVISVFPGIHRSSLEKQVDLPAGASEVDIAVLAIRDDTFITLTPQMGIAPSCA